MRDRPGLSGVGDNVRDVSIDQDAPHSLTALHEAGRAEVGRRARRARRAVPDAPRVQPF